MDNELVIALEKENKESKIEEGEDDSLSDYDFIATCLRIGLRIEDLKDLEYKEVAKILICYSRNERKTNKKTKYRKATQDDWDRFASS